METVANEIEQAGERMMEIELRKIETQITDSEEAILHRFSDATEKQMAILQEMAWFLDNGHTGCSANNWGMLAYFTLCRPEHVWNLRFQQGIHT